MWDVPDVRLVAGGASVFQLFALIGFYMSTEPNLSVSHVLACNEGMCVAFTIVVSLLAYFQFLNLTFYFVGYSPRGSDVQQTGVMATFFSAWMLSLTLRYTIGSGPHVTVATLFIGSYLLAIFMQQYQDIGRTRMSLFTLGLFLSVLFVLAAWVYTRNHWLEWLAWGILTLVQCLLNLPIRMPYERAQTCQFSQI